MICRRCNKDLPKSTDNFVSVHGVIKMLPLCLECHATESRERRRSNRAKGLCHCGAPPKEGGTRCPKHAQATIDRYYKVLRDDPQWMKENAERSRKHLQALKAETFKAYGNVCTCHGCKETHVEFLSIDHIVPVSSGKVRVTRRGVRNGERRPSPVRASNRAGHGLYRWLKKHGFPPEFRLLCMNCNFSRGHFGYCPHERLEV